MVINGDGGYGLLAAYRWACSSSRLAWSKGAVTVFIALLLMLHTAWLCHIIGSLSARLSVCNVEVP